MKKRIILSGIIGMLAVTGFAQNIVNDSSATAMDKEVDLKEVTVTSATAMRRMGGAVNGVSIGRKELFRAACCNLGESFTTNPSVDVSYSDATTGAKQIKLLGLSGTYVQMLTENLPNFRGAAMPYALGYVPGAWMKSIQVSKGSSSVKNGYESITGQINIDYKKPEDAEGMEINLFGDSKTRIEANVDGNIHLNNKLSTNLMAHYEDNIKEMDDNDDSFYDKPKVRQFNVQNRWLWAGDRYIFHGGIGALTEKRKGGQKTLTDGSNGKLFNIGINTNRFDAYMKHAFILDPDHGTNIALLSSASMHEQSAEYGYKNYYINEKNAYASLVFETNFTEIHNISAGLSINYDYLGQKYNGSGLWWSDRRTRTTIDIDKVYADITRNERETVPGAYAQYTLNLHHKFTAMAGLRVDHSSIYGTFVTPRFHVKFAPTEIFSVRLSAGKGYRTVHPLAENSYFMASGRTMDVDNLRQEAAWNYGVSTAFNIPLFGKTMKLNAEYYYTTFKDQAVIDYDTDPNVIHITNLDGKSYSHTFQIDATYPVIKGMTLTAAYRLNDAKTTYGGILMERPLTSKYKGLITASYKTPMEKWQFDVTLQLNGGGRMPNAYENADGTMSWNERFKAYEQLSAQITREFRNFSVYIGGENLTNFTQSNPIINASNPWSDKFEPTLIWGPVHGRMLYAGVRIKLNKM